MIKDMHDWRGEYEDFHHKFSARGRKPIIGITGNYGDKGCELAEGYYHSLLQAGAVPVVIPAFENLEALADLLDCVDGIVLSGGADLNPLLMGENPIPELGGICPQRDKAELWLVRMAYNRQIPMLGICRGIQVMALALGGKIYQDIKTQYGTTSLLKHNQNLNRNYASHWVQIDVNSLLYNIFNRERIAVNSFHHQAVSCPGDLLRVSACSADGVVEAIESTQYKSILGVQWHPECFSLCGDNSMMPLFHWLVDEACSYAQSKTVHRHVLTLDSHCDTPMCFDKAMENGLTPEQLFGTRTDIALVDLHKMCEGGLDASIMVAYLPQKERDDASLARASKKANDLLNQVCSMVNAHADVAGIARTPADLYTLKAQGKKAIMLGVENGYAIGKNLGNIEAFRQKGVVYMTLCHNGDNDICDSARGEATHGGVSPFGRQVIREMNRVGMMVDLSHASEKSFYDALEISVVPIVCSHSSSRALCNHPRNLSDDQLRALAHKGGVAQVTFYGGFLCEQGKACIHDAVNHLLHMVKVMGVEHVGIGTDFDGDGGVPGIASASEVINFTRELLKKNFTEADIRLIWGGNFLRVMEEVQNYKMI